MDEISQEQIDKAVALFPEEIKEKEDNEITESDFKQLLEEMKNPVQAQQKIAVQIKIFLDKKMKKEMGKDGNLTDSTRRWVESYNKILEKIQQALHGDKHVSLNLHQISHSQIATKMREAMKK